MIFVLLPAYNESKALQTLIPSIAQTLGAQKYRILVVDDGSTDSTPHLLQTMAAEYPMQVLRHNPNQGYGAAIRTGAEWAIRQGRPEDVLITLDADNTHLPMYFPDLLSEIEKGFDVVTASYSRPGGASQGVPLLRQLMSRIVNQLFSIACGFPGVSTYTNGFRAYQVSALQRASSAYPGCLVEDTGFPGGVELFLKVVKAGGRPSEVPFTLHYENRGGDSKIHLGQTIRRYLQLWVRFRQF